MAREFELRGRIEGLPPKMTEDAFWQRMILFFEENHWICCGGLARREIRGCIAQTASNRTESAFRQIFLDFLVGNGRSFHGESKAFFPIRKKQDAKCTLS